jgi:predicted nucleic acid-binding protein
VLEKCVADTGPLLHLAEIDRLRYLNCVGAIVISSQVRAELRRHFVRDRVLELFAGLVRVERVTLSEIAAQRGRLQGFGLHKADLSTVALAEKMKPNFVLTDDLQLRKALETQGHKVVGSVGVVVRAFTFGIIDKAELQTIIDELLDGSSLYTSRSFRRHVYDILNDIE